MKLNSNPIPKILKEKYEGLQKLIENMTDEDFTKRPSCENILNNIFGWCLDLKEIKNESYFPYMRSDPPESIQANFHKYFICRKMEQLSLK